jgi:hypothetical protein
MRILFFCGSLQSGKDGVGDYVRSLAETCILQGNECQMIALNDHHISECVSSVDFVGGTKLGSLRLPAALPWPERMNLAAAFRDQFQPDWLSFQFVAYGYHDHGIVWKLSRHFQTLLAGCPLHIMFHEIWVGMPPDAPFKHRLIGALQRLSIRRMIAMVKPRLVTTSNPLYLAALRGAGMDASLLPLFGNIPIVDRGFAPEFPLPLGEAGITADNRTTWWVGLFFGGLYPEWKPEPFLGILKSSAQKAGKSICLISLGRMGAPGQNLWRQLQDDYPGITFLTLGEHTTELVSILMQAADFGIAASPWDLIGKSGSATAMLEHGLPVIVTREDRQSRFEAPDPSSADPLFHRCDAALESKLIAGLPKAAPHLRRAGIAARFCSLLKKNS